MGNQQPPGRTRSDTYTRYERDGEDGRYVTLEADDAKSHEERILSRHDPSLLLRPRNSNREKEKKTIPVVFRYPASPKDKEAQLIGSFTNWKELVQMVKSDNDFVTIVELPEGKHQYKFIIDGRWEYDSSDRNNVITVKKSDFEVMEALRIDSIHTNNQNQNTSNSTNKSQSTDMDLARSPPGTYDQIWPPPNKDEFSPHDKPPLLPPHLLHIILNKDTSAHCEPALLPEPNHVMLKHLYALSIRDGVMVLSTTTRYKQKYVTTCFYKPTEK
ncbi:unnamed protein product [Didymodactylos carnosus]|uniref:5'-AMP-activated protein kinase subunit beta-1 n=1 Tax=Didymodactylos carnosus TaxID=1234261 RepID=A0A813NUK0_9BILA|nr:unnamed protein product [Didymodactylos carnosus]CAF0787317.1 unnamed protein product [Didymodactylos carnosus]CAF3523418.1 unnamed protein product [Didymodactylos carnosus]CAF3569665.1 unnamed protein product [Didymodactylos carnosus]